MRYYSVHRPVAPGTFPHPDNNRVLEIKNFDARTYVGRIGREAWGYIEYESPLNALDRDAYELVATSDSEDKHKICGLLCEVLQETRGAADLISLEFDSGTEIVTAAFQSGGTKRINVACDSGMAMIRDIVNHLGV